MGRGRGPFGGDGTDDEEDGKFITNGLPVIGCNSWPLQRSRRNSRGRS